jgi:hypothetical protein
LPKRETAAKQYGTGKAYDTWQKLTDDPEIEILDIAVPPDVQLAVIRYVAKKSILREYTAKNRWPCPSPKPGRLPGWEKKRGYPSG